MFKLPSALTKVKPHSPKSLGDHIYQMYNKAQSLRQPNEARWDTLYSMYRASADDMRKLKSDSVESGNRTDWRHNVNAGKCFEVVETLVSYYKGATFPTDDWFGVEGMEPELGQIAQVIKLYTKFKLEEGKVRDLFDHWLRWYCLFGIAAAKIGWKSCIDRVPSRKMGPGGLTATSWKNVERSEFSFEALPPRSFWLDGTTTPNEGGIFVQLSCSKQELAYYAEEGYYTCTPEQIEAYDDMRKSDANVSKTAANKTEASKLIEYYGPVLYDGVQYWCVHAVFLNNELIRLADSEYWCGNPYVVGVALPDLDSVYGMSIIDPVTGNLHTTNILLNSRLDNMAVRLDQMFTMVEDGVLDPSDIYTAPGKILKVSNHDNIRPMDLGPPNFVVTYNEASVQNQIVDAACSTGPLVGATQPRGGERVTASEIQAVQQSGGNRLQSMHMHFEDSSTLPFLSKAFWLIQQYTDTEQLVKVYDAGTDMDAFYQLVPEYLSYPFKLNPLGASYIVESQRNLTDIMNLLDVSGRVPQMAERINYDKILNEILRQMRFKNPTSFLKAAPTPMAPQGGDMPGAPLDQSRGGELAALGMQQQIAENPAELAANLGVQNADQVDPAVLQQAATSMLEQSQQPQ